MAPKSTLNAKSLETLGAVRPAELLNEISIGSAVAKPRLRLELAGAQSPKEAGREVAKRLTIITHFCDDWPSLDSSTQLLNPCRELSAH